MIIDRRNVKNMRINVKRFLDRYKEFMRQQLLNSMNGEKVNLNLLHEPMFRFDDSHGVHNIVVPGNDKWMTGDIIERDEWLEWLMKMLGMLGSGDDEEGDGEDGDGETQGGKGGGIGSAGFRWILNESEFRGLLFDDLELPFLNKKSFDSTTEEYTINGISKNGSLFDLLKTYENILARDFAIKQPLEEQLKIAIQNKNQEAIDLLQKKIKGLVFADDDDIRYKRFDIVEDPFYKAVIFFVMDVSGSMGEVERDIAKRFCMLLKIFIESYYKKSKCEYIIFTEEAFSVNEEEFFSESLSGGTTLTSGLELEEEIINDKYYGNDWNKYTIVLSDSGLSDFDDSITKMRQFLDSQELLIYTHIGRFSESSAYEIVGALKDKNNFKYALIQDKAYVINKFRELFKK